MNGFYRRQYGGSGMHQPSHGNGNDDGVLMIDAQQDGMGSTGMAGSQSLDEIVSRNSKELQRGGVPVPFSNNGQPLEPGLRRMAMMDFNATSPVSPLDIYPYDTGANTPVDGMMQPAANLSRHNSETQLNRQNLSGHLALNTQLSDQHTQSFAGMGPSSTFPSPLPVNPGIDLEMTSPYMASNMPVTMDLSDPTMSAMMNADPSAVNFFPQSHFNSSMAVPQMRQNFATISKTNPMGLTNSNVNQKEAFISNNSPQSANAAHNQSMSPRDANVMKTSQAMNVSNQAPSSQMANIQFKQNSIPSEKAAQSQTPNSMHEMKFNWTTPPGGFPSTMNNKPHTESQFKNAYSSTGFDMLGVLMRVATRPNAEINVGSVDLSCAFVVCDAEKEDSPIVYCSENFERLTGYNRHMILGRNCRFLQSPDGKVEAGKKRKYVDDDSVYYLKNMITARREAQMSLINYRKGGQPFMNLLTIIPITWDSDQIKYIVGFQVDLVEQPNSVLNKNPDGSYAISYQRSLNMPRYIFHSADNSGQLDLGQTIPRDDVSTVLSTFSSGDSELSKRIWDKLLLENTDDVIHVLSLKGLFLYLSPSSHKVLEYEAHELVGRALSSVCHPSDIVPVTRELKETTSGSSVNVVFRIRRKESGYMWFEGHGSLHTEQGKGRKCIILVGRERPVYALAKNDILAAGGIGENELWSKISTSGMMLYVSSNVRQLLDRQPDELVGTSMQALMRQESKAEVGRVFQLVRSGRKASVKHEMINKRGQVLQAFTTLYPGDATEGQKPTFIVAQTRLLKHSRGGPKSSSQVKQERDTSSVQSGNSAMSAGVKRLPSNEPTSISQTQFTATDGFAMTHSGHDGLAIGHQDDSLASEANLFDELKTTRSTSWQYELRQMEKRNRLLAEEVQNLLAAKKKRKRRKGAGQLQKDCANCHTSVTPEWRRGPSGNRDLCNSCGLRWAKQNGRVSPRTPSQHSLPSAQSSIASVSPRAGRNGTSQLNAHEGLAQASMSSTNDLKSTMQGLACAQAPDSKPMGLNSSQSIAKSVHPKIDEVVEPT